MRMDTHCQSEAKSKDKVNWCVQTIYSMNVSVDIKSNNNKIVIVMLIFFSIFITVKTDIRKQYISLPHSSAFVCARV